MFSFNRLIAASLALPFRTLRVFSSIGPDDQLDGGRRLAHDRQPEEAEVVRVRDIRQDRYP